MEYFTNLIDNILSGEARKSKQAAQEILKFIENDKVKCFSLAAKTISAICLHLQKNSHGSDKALFTYNKLIIEILKYLNDKKYETFILQNFKFYTYYLLNNNCIDDLKIVLENFRIKKVICTDSYKICFDIVKNVQFYLVQKEGLQSGCSDQIQNCFNNFEVLFELTDNEEQIFSFCQDIFIHESSASTFYKNPSNAENFIKISFRKLKNIIKIENSEEFFLFLTTTFLNLNKYEVKLGSQKIWSLEFLKAVIENVNIKKDPFQSYALSMLLYISSLRVKEFTQQNFQDIFRKLLKLFEYNQKNNWFNDFQITLLQLLTRNWDYISNNIDENNLELVTEIVYKIAKNIFFKTPSWKSNCTYCKNFKSHEVINLFTLSVQIYDKNIKLDSLNGNIINLITYSLLFIERDFQNVNECKYNQVQFKNSFHMLHKIISRLKSKKLAAGAIEILDYINKNCYREEVSSELFLKIYLSLYNLLEEKSMALQVYTALMKIYMNKDKEVFSSFLFHFINQIKDENIAECTTRKLIKNLNKKFLFYVSFSEEEIKKLTQAQIEVITTYKMFTGDQIEILFEEVIKENSLSDLEFILFVRNSNQLIKLEKIQNQVQKIKMNYEQVKQPSFEKLLILAYIYRCEALQEFEKFKECFDLKIVDEESLTSIDIRDFGKINFEKETQTIDLAIKSLNYFKKLYSLLDQNDCSNEKNEINFNAIIDDVSYLARSFQLRGFFDLAAESWKLVFDFACNLYMEESAEIELHKMRALAFFCKNNESNVSENINLKIVDIINKMSKQILEHYHKIDTLSPRRQNYVLLCILNLAYYYCHQDDINSSKALVKMVQFKINSMPERTNKFELIRANIFAIEFYFRTKKTTKLSISPYMYVIHMLKEFKKIVFLTSEDSLNMSCFLIEFFENIASYFYGILDTSVVSQFLTYFLTFAIRNGMTLRIVKLFLIWIKINLQNSDLFYAKLKLLILDKLLETKFNSVSGDSIEKCYKEAVKLAKNKNILRYNSPGQIEEIRKAFQSITSIDAEIMSNHNNFQNDDINKYFVEHMKNCHCNLCNFPIYKFIFFDIGCCNFKFNFLQNRNCFEAKFFIEKALQWWSQNSDQSTKMEFMETLFYLYLDYIKILRLNKQYSEAIDYCEIASQFIDNNKNFHNNLIWKVIEHYFAIKANSDTKEIAIMESPTARNKIPTSRSRRGVKL